jgi:hypothetical protein
MCTVCNEGKKKVKDFNVYLRPLIDKMKDLWEHGARVTDMSIANEAERSYVARAVLMWTMHDYPGYGITSSLQTQGYYACPHAVHKKFHHTAQCISGRPFTMVTASFWLGVTSGDINGIRTNSTEKWNQV